MGAGIEVLAGCFDRLHTEFGQDPEELLERQFHTLDQRRIASIVRAALIARSMLSTTGSSSLRSCSFPNRICSR